MTNLIQPDNHLSKAVNLTNFPQLRYQPPPLYFMHVPKTAGSSWCKLLQAVYTPQAMRTIYRQNLPRYTATDLNRLRCVASHLGPALLPWLASSAGVVITMLREPVEQFVSQLYFHQAQIKREPHLFAPDYLAAVQPLIDADLRTLLETPLLMIPDNPQSCCLGIFQPIAPYLKEGAIGCQGTLLRTMPFGFTQAMDMGQIAAAAQEQVQKMTLIGITEAFAESTELLCDLLGVPVPTTLPTENLGLKKQGVQLYHYRQHLPPDLLERVLAKTQDDQALYTQACAIFAEQRARYQARPRRTYTLAPHLRALVKPWRSATGKPVRQLINALFIRPLKNLSIKCTLSRWIDL
jgi:hypothetical protein